MIPSAGLWFAKLQRRSKAAGSKRTVPPAVPSMLGHFPDGSGVTPLPLPPVESGSGTTIERKPVSGLHPLHPKMHRDRLSSIVEVAGNKWFKRVALVSGLLIIFSVVAVRVAYPRVAKWAIKSKVLPRLERKLGRAVTVAEIDVGWGHATIKNLVIAGTGPKHGASERTLEARPQHGANERTLEAGPQHGANERTLGAGPQHGANERTLEAGPQHGANERTLEAGPGGRAALTVDSIELEFSGLRSAFGIMDIERAVVNHPSVYLSKPDIDLLRNKLFERGESDASGSEASSSPGLRTMLPQRIEIAQINVELEQHGKISIESIIGSPMKQMTARNLHGSMASLSKGGVTIDADSMSIVGRDNLELENITMSTPVGSARLIRGSFKNLTSQPTATVHGDYPSSSGATWQATVLSEGRGPSLTVQADIVTNEGAGTEPKKMNIKGDAAEITFSGDIAVAGVTIDQPTIVNRPMTNLAFAIGGRGRYDRAARKLEVPVATLSRAGVQLMISGTVQMGAHRTVDMRATVPPVSCQTALRAIPAEFVPNLTGYELGGTFALDVRGQIDWENLAEATLESTGGLDGCKVLSAPVDSPTKLAKSFTHRVERSPNQFEDIVIGSKNSRFIDYDSIPEYILKSLISTEDPTFDNRRGFAAPGLARALIENLKSGKLRVGGSTIPMQLAKNLFLNGERTLSRKVQEMVLAWHIETTIPRHRILEIYLNAIEFGPGIYGLGEASRKLFGKAVYELMPLEAAYFSAIVPRPRSSYSNFCERKLDKETQARVRRALGFMVNSGSITSEDWDASVDTELEFASMKETKEQCLARRHEALTQFVTR